MSEKRTTPTLFNIISVVALVVALAGPVGAHVKDEDHLWAEHIKPKIAQPGTINDSNNPVDYSKLKNVPLGFADGSDYGIERVGFGLNVVSPILAKRYFTVDSEEVQKRVTGTCSAGAISAVKEDGTVSCSSGGGSTGAPAFSVNDNDTGIFCNTEYCTEGKLNDLPLGSWLVIGNITADCEMSDHCQDQGILVSCRLNAAGTNIGSSGVTIFNADTFESPIPLSGVHTFEGDVSLECTDFGGLANAADYKGGQMSLIAVKLGSLN